MSHEELAGISSALFRTGEELINHRFNTGTDIGDSSKADFELLLNRLLPATALEKNVSSFVQFLSKEVPISVARQNFRSFKCEGIALYCGVRTINAHIIGTRHERFRIAHSNKRYYVTTRPERARAEHTSRPEPPERPERTRRTARPRGRGRGGGGGPVAMQQDELAFLFGQVVDRGVESPPPPQAADFPVISATQVQEVRANLPPPAVSWADMVNAAEERTDHSGSTAESPQ